MCTVRLQTLQFETLHNDITFLGSRPAVCISNPHSVVLSQGGESSVAMSLSVARAAVLLANDAGDDLEPLWEAALLRLDVEALSSNGSVDLTAEVRRAQTNQL